MPVFRVLLEKLYLSQPVKDVLEEFSRPEKDLVMRKNVDPFLNVSNSKTVCSTNFKFGGYFDQGHSFVQ